VTGDVIWSCPDCGTDLEDDDRMFWCPECEHLWTPAEAGIWDYDDERIIEL
jgi:uncharacterized Zn ribbon protein